MDEKQTPPAEGVKPYRVEYHKSPLHRYIPADGGWVGLNGYGKIILNFFNDTPPLPTATTMEAAADGKSFTDTEPQVIFPPDLEASRQFEVSIVINAFSARQLHTALGNFIKMAEEQAARQSK